MPVQGQTSTIKLAGMVAKQTSQNPAPCCLEVSMFHQSPLRRALAPIVVVVLAALTGALVLNKAPRHAHTQQSATRSVISLLVNSTGKRLLDIVAVLAALLLIGPVMLIIAILVRL